MSTEIEKFKEITVTAPQILQENQLRVSKAKEFGSKLLEKAQQGMNDEVEKELNGCQVKMRKTLELMLSNRKPITQLMDSFKKEFTSTEAELDPKKPESIYYKIQQTRNAYAQEKLEKQKKAEEERLRKQALEKESGEVEAQISMALENYFSDYLSDYIDQIYEYFNSSTLENLEDTEKKIKKANEVYPHEHFDQFKTSVTTIYLSKDDKIRIKINVIDGKYEEFKKRFVDKMKEVKVDLTSKIPSRKAELEQMAKANAEEQKKLKAEQEKRQKEAAEKRAIEKKEAEEKAKAEAEAKKKAAEMQAMFESETSEKATRTGYDMIVKHPSAYAYIFQFWFDKEGKNLAIDEIEKKSLKQMKTFCEKYAHKTDETIQSPYIEYKEIAKVAARK
jgi:hypothetical protein